MQFNDFTQLFLDKSKDYTWHIFIKRKQYYENCALLRKINNLHLLPGTWLIASKDFIGDYHLKTSIINAGKGTKLGKVQYLMLYHCFVSDNHSFEVNYYLF